MCIVAKPKTNEKKKPKRFSGDRLKSLIFKRTFPASTIGILIRKLSLKACSSSNFLKSKDATVSPERESPGKAAKPLF